MADDFDQALQALARLKGVPVEQLKREMLEREMGLGGSPPARAPAREAREPSRAIERAELGDATGSRLARIRADAVERHSAQAFPGSPVVRYDGDDRGETAAEAQERWYEEETELPDGVHGLGGQEAGGIFGSGPIATSIYDPAAMGRADGRMASTATAKLLGVIERLETRLTQAEERAALGSGDARGALPGRQSKRLGRGR